MIKYFRKYNKKLLAVFGVGLMITFVMSTGTKSQSGNDYVIGTANGNKVYVSELSLAKHEWDMLKRLYVEQKQLDYNGQPQVNYAEVIWSLGPTVTDPYGRTRHNVAVETIEKNPEVFMLLLKEANKMGVYVSDAQVSEIFREVQTRSYDLRDPDVAEDVRRVLRDFLMVRGAYEQAASTIKVSQPFLQQQIAGNWQEISVNLVEYKAAEFSVKPPTTQQITEQFTAYKDKSADSQDNPFGFGYRYPNRVKLQYLELRRADVQKAVEASRSNYDWEVAANKYYLKHKEEFPATQPAATTSPLSLGPVTQPSSKPAFKEFSEVRQEIRDRILKAEVDKQMDALMQLANHILSTDWAAYKKAVGDATTATRPITAPMTAYKVRYDSPEYLPAVAQDIQRQSRLILAKSGQVDTSSTPSPQEIEKQAGVLPACHSLQDQFMGEKELTSIAGLGRARVNNGPDFITYATKLAEAFVPAAQKDNSNVLALYKPSLPLKNLIGDEYVFRLTAADPAHAPVDVSEVMDRVKTDLHLQETFKQAREAATEMLDAAKTTGLNPAAKSAGRKLIETGLYANRPGTMIPTFPLSSSSNTLFIRESFNLLKEAATTGKKNPIMLVEIPRDGKALVVQLEQVKPMLDTDTQFLADVQIKEQLRVRFNQMLSMSWFDYEAVVSRTKYIPEHPPTEKKEPA